MKRILTITINPAVDKSSRVERVEPEHKLKCDAAIFHPGGGGINVSRAIRKLGGTSVALYLTGGPPGSILKQLLDTEGIAQYQVQIRNWIRENLTILEISTNRQFRFGMPGPAISQEEYQDFLNNLRAVKPVPELVVASGSLPEGVPDDFYSLIADYVREQNARLILDTSGKPLITAMDNEVFLVKPNRKELGLLAGRKLESIEEFEAFSRSLVQQGRARVVIVSLGEEGAILVWQEGVQRFFAPDVPVKSKVGAGDSMVAGIVLAIARDWNIVESVRYGVAAGTAATMTSGTELCRLDDTERLYSHMKSGT